MRTVKSFDSDETSEDFKITDISRSSAGTTGYFLNYFTLECTKLYGTDPLVIEITNEDIAKNFKFVAFTVTYWDDPDGEAPAYDVTRKYGRDFGTPILYKKDGEDAWTEATGDKVIRLMQTPAYVKLGNAVTKFWHPKTPKDGQVIATIDPRTGIIGTSKDVKFFTTTEDDADMPYSVTYTHTPGCFGLNRAQRASYLLAKPTGSSTYNASSAPQTISSFSKEERLTESNSAFTVTASTTSLDPWSFELVTAAQATACTEPVTGFDGIFIQYTSANAPTPQAPMAPVVTFPSNVTFNTKTACYTAQGAFDASIAANAADQSTGTTMYYMISPTPVTAATFTKDKAADGTPVHIDSDCFLAVRAYTAVGGHEVASGVVCHKIVVKKDVVGVTDYAFLLDKNNAGKLVRLDFPLQILSPTHLTATECNIYARDTLNNPVHMLVRQTSDLTDKSTSFTSVIAATPGKAFRPASGANINNIVFCPKGGAVGELEFQGDHPVIVLRDESAGKDYFDLCYTGDANRYSTKITPEQHLMNGGEKYVLNTFIINQRTAVSPADLGRIISIPARYEGSVFTASGATEPLEIAATDGSIQKLGNVGASQWASLSPDTPVDATDYIVTGTVIFDSDKQKYALAPLAYTAPATTTPEMEIISTVNGTQVKSSETAADGKSATYVIELIGSKFRMNFKNGNSTPFFYNIMRKGFTTTVPKSNVAYQDFSSVSFPESGKIEYDVQLANSSFAQQAPYTVSETFRLTVIDVIGTARKFATIDEMQQAITDGQLAAGDFACLNGTSIAVADVTDKKGTLTSSKEINAILLKDITPIKNNNDADLKCLPLTTTTLIKNYTGSYRTGNTTYTGKVVENGDSIKSVTFRIVIDDNGNVSGDLTNLQSYFKFSKACQKGAYIGDEEYRPWLTPGEPLFKNYISAMSRTRSIDTPEEAEFTKDHVDKMVTISGVKIAKKESGESGIATQADISDGYVARMKTDVPLSWELFCLSADKALNHMTLEQLQDGGDQTYTVNGLVRLNNETGYVIEVSELKPDVDNPISVCEHPHHDTYYQKIALTDDMAGKLVRLQGVKITRSTSTPYVYTIDNFPVKLNLDPLGKGTSSSTNPTYTTLNNACQSNATAKNPLVLTGVLRLTEVPDGSTEADQRYTLDLNSIVSLAPQGTANQLQLTFNGKRWSGDGYDPFYTSGKLGYSAPEGTKVLYTLVDRPEEVQYEVEPDATDAQKEAAKEAAIRKLLDEKEDQIFTDATDITIDHTVWIKLYSCEPGKTTLNTVVTKVGKNADDVTSLDALIEADVPSTPGLRRLHFRNELLVTYVNNGIAMATDGIRTVALKFDDPTKGLPEAGDYINNFAVKKQGTRGVRDYNYSFIMNAPSVDDFITATPGNTIQTPQLQDVDEFDTDLHRGMAFGLTGVHLSGNQASGFDIKTIAKAGTPEIPGSNDDHTTLHDISLNNVFGLSLTDVLNYNEEAEYRITGFAMPAPLQSMTNIGQQTEQPLLEFWPTEIIRRKKIETPVITLSAEKSLEAQTATIACEEPRAQIEYSTDGGKTWLPYSEALTLDKSTTLHARATHPYLDGSEVTTASFIKLYASAKPTVDFKQSKGKTTVTLTLDDADPDSYEIFYTLDGTEPTDRSTAYKAPFEVSDADVVVKAILIEKDPEAVASAVAEWAVPVRSNDVTIGSRTAADGNAWVELTAPAGADVEAIYYTTDGTEPTEASQKYSGEIMLSATATVKAMLKERGKSMGDIVSKKIEVFVSGDVTITVDQQNSKTVITITGPGKIYYSIDGGAEKQYDGAITIANDTQTELSGTISAYALEEGKRPGAAKEASYKVSGISGIGADGAEADGVKVEGNTITVPEGAQTFDIAGRRVNPQGLPRGIYIVRLASGKAVKVVIR